MSDDKKKPRGRPIKNEVKTIPAPAERIAKAIFHAADKRYLSKESNGFC